MADGYIRLLDVFAEIIALVAAGEPVRRALKLHDVSPRLFYAAIDADPALAERYARAKAAGMDAVADEMIDIADNAQAGLVDRARLQVDTRKWLLAKLAPKKYGEKLDLNHGGVLNVTLTGADANL